MSIRIPFVVTVVGALLVGGATTGTTAARWTDTMGSGSGQVQSAVMKFKGEVSAGSPLTITKGSATPVTTTLTLTDESTVQAKNLVQNLSITGTTAPSGVKLSVQQGACPTTVPTAAASGYTATNIAQTDVQTRTRALCVALAADSSAATGAGSVQLSLGGKQVRPGNVALSGGWSYAPGAVSIPITVAAAQTPTVPGVRCVPNSRNGTTIQFDWPTVSGESYVVEQSTTQSSGFAPVSSPSNPYTVTLGTNNTTFYFRVKSTVGSTSSAYSRIIKTSQANGASSITCEVLQ